MRNSGAVPSGCVELNGLFLCRSFSEIGHRGTDAALLVRNAGQAQANRIEALLDAAFTENLTERGVKMDHLLPSDGEMYVFDCFRAFMKNYGY